MLISARPRRRPVRRALELALVLSTLTATACLGSSSSSGDGDDASQQAPLTITAVQPSALPFSQGGQLTITGEGLDDESLTLTVGGVSLTPKLREATRLVVDVPPREQGGQAEIVLTRGEQRASWSAFRFTGISAQALRFIGRSAIHRKLEHLLDVPGNPNRQLAYGKEGLGSYVVSGGQLMEEAFYEEELLATARAVCLHDLDGDKLPDLFIVPRSGEPVIWQGSAPGLFTPPAPPEPEEEEAPPEEMPPEEMPAVPEVTLRTVVCDTSSGELLLHVGAKVASREVLATLPAVEFGPVGISQHVVSPMAAPVRSILVTQLDADPHADVILKLDGFAPSLWFGGEKGLARAPIGATPKGAEDARQITLADLDADGDHDVLLATPHGVDVWRNDAGTFHDVSREVAGATIGALRAIAAADLDNDAQPDLLTMGENGEVKLLIGESFKLFDASNALLPTGYIDGAKEVSLRDADGDGDADIVFTTGEVLSLMVNWAPSVSPDSDGDGLPDEIDVCPQDYDPEQKNRDAHPFLCESPAACQAELGCEVIEGGFGTLYLVCGEDRKHTRDGGRDFCERRGAHLLRLESAVEQTALGERVKGRYWTDPTDRDTEGSFVFEDGTLAPYTGWLENQPDNAGDNEDCVELISSDDSLGWNDLPCDGERAVICEVAPRTGAPDPGDACDLCPDVYDPQQLDSDGDGIGDRCDDDEEGQ